MCSGSGALCSDGGLGKEEGRGHTAVLGYVGPGLVIP